MARMPTNKIILCYANYVLINVCFGFVNIYQIVRYLFCAVPEGLSRSQTHPRQLFALLQSNFHRVYLPAMSRAQSTPQLTLCVFGKYQPASDP